METAIRAIPSAKSLDGSLFSPYRRTIGWQTTLTKYPVATSMPTCNRLRVKNAITKGNRLDSR